MIGRLRARRRRHRVERAAIAALDLTPELVELGYVYRWNRDTLPANRRGHLCRRNGDRFPGERVGVTFRDGRSYIVDPAGLVDARDPDTGGKP